MLSVRVSLRCLLDSEFPHRSSEQLRDPVGPFPPLGRSGSYPSVHWYYERLRLPIGHPASLWSSLGLAVPTYVSRRRRRRQGLLRSWGTSGRAPPSQTPVGPLRLAMRTTAGAGSCCCPAAFAVMPVPHSSPSIAVSPPRGASVLPPPIAQRRLPTTISLSKLNHAAFVLAVYASQLSFSLPRSYGHARLASGWWPAFTGRGSIPRKVPNEVSVSITRHPPHPSFATQATSEFGSSPRSPRQAAWTSTRNFSPASRTWSCRASLTNCA